MKLGRMRAFRTWARRIGGGAVALVLALLVLAPSLDAVTCAADGISPVVAAGPASAVTAAPVGAAAADLHDLDAPGPCIHGHAHSGAACLEDALEPAHGLSAAGLTHGRPVLAPVQCAEPLSQDPPPRA